MDNVIIVGMKKFGRIISFCLILLSLLVACGSASVNNEENVVIEPATATPISGQNVTANNTPYPSDGSNSATATDQDSGYIAPASDLENTAQPNPPNPDTNLPSANPTTGVVGGILIEKIDDIGYIPLQPKSLLLGEVLYTDTGQAAYVGTGDESISAQLYQTGVFIFQDVPPGEYGLVADLGFTQFIIEDSVGNPTIIEIEAGEVLDLGQLITGVQR